MSLYRVMSGGDPLSTREATRVDYSSHSKGKYLLAAVKIRRGTCILTKSPLLEVDCHRADLFDAEAFWSAGKRSGAPQVLQDFNGLNAEAQRLFNELTYFKKAEDELEAERGGRKSALTMEEWECLSRCKFNSFDQTSISEEMPESGAENQNQHQRLYVFHHISFINHSCRPNAVFKWHPDRKQGMVHALREINPGEDIEICYTPGFKHAFKTRDERGEVLKNHWKFACSCDICEDNDVATEDNALRQQAQKDYDSWHNLVWPWALYLTDASENPTQWPSGYVFPKGEDAAIAGTVCKDQDHREHRRQVVYGKSLVKQLRHLGMRDKKLAFVYHELELYYQYCYEHGTGNVDKTLLGFRTCDECSLVFHRSALIEAAVEAYDNEILIHVICSGEDHPHVAKVMKMRDDLFSKKARCDSLTPGP